MIRRTLAFVLLVLVAALPAFAAENTLRANDRVAVCGDSITEQKLYTVYIQDYLLMCQPASNLRTMQFGWSGETSWGFVGRMKNDVIWFQPTVATTCYGMNDGGYSPMNADKARRYREAQTAIVRSFKQAGVRVILVGSPGVVDTDTFRQSREQAAMYNQTLAALRDIAREVARDENVVFANVFDPMMDAMTKAKAKHGPQYHVGGGDGVHPAPNGHLIMAYAFLKAMGCDGHIGTITLDLAANAGDATEGHKVLAFQNGTLELESSRYPFCFYGNPASPDSTCGIIEFMPFNDDLNRFVLVVKNPPADRFKVKWGNVEKEFAAADLAKGINLAAEFLDNPFSDPFLKVEQTIRAQQNYETPLQKELIHNLARWAQLVPEEKESFERILTGAKTKSEAFRDASAAAVRPVRHTLTIQAVR